MRALGDWYVGKTFGKWTILTKSEPGVKHPMLTAVCSCGETRRVSRDNILAGKSSGCAKCRSRAGRDNASWSGFKDIPGNVFGIMVRCAAVRGLECNISIEVLQELWERQKGLCALTGMPLVISGNSGNRTASVDRINSKRGYVIGNIQFVHKKINKMKNDIDEDLFVEMCKRVAWHKAA